MLETTEAWMSKQAFGCSLSNPAPYTAGDETDDENDTAPNEVDSFHDKHEQPRCLAS